MAMGVALGIHGASTARRTKPPGCGYYADRIRIYGQSPRRDKPGMEVRRDDEEKSAGDSCGNNDEGEQFARWHHEGRVG